MPRILALLIVGALLTLAASAGLAAGPVDGSVTQKFIAKIDDNSSVIAVDGTPYVVPREFYVVVQVGDIVHFDGTNWTITSRGAK